MTYTVVAHYPSKSNPGGEGYVVKRRSDGQISCNCRGWIYARNGVHSCTHTKDYIAAMGAAAVGQAVQAAVQTALRAAKKPRQAEPEATPREATPTPRGRMFEFPTEDEVQARKRR